MTQPFQEGERVLVRSESGRYSFLIELTSGRTIHTSDGILKHDQLIGCPEGTRILTHMNITYIAMRPTLIQKMMKVKRKTQIIYPKEAARIAIECSIGSGSRVIEMGGGSGALTILLATLVGPEGRIYSFDRNEEFQAQARENAARYGLDKRVDYAILTAGEPFGLTEVDAVILDLPEPWLAIRPAFDALRPGGQFASITPNVEQLKRLHIEAEDAGFSELEAKEILERQILVRRQEGVRPSEKMIGFTGFLLFGRKIP